MNIWEFLDQATFWQWVGLILIAEALSGIVRFTFTSKK